MAAKPLVSCVMLTMPGREAFAAKAQACFTAQTYTPRELIQVAGHGSIGAKRNKGNGWAHGDLIAHWDDDDWSHPERLQDQVNRLLETEAELTGYHEMLFARDEDRAAWLYSSGMRTYAIGTSMMYWRAIWRDRPFLDTSHAEDNAFLYGDPAHGRKKLQVVSVPAGKMMVARIHAGNTLEKPAPGDSWRRVGWKEIEETGYEAPAKN